MSRDSGAHDAGVEGQRRSQLRFTRRRPMKMEKLMSLLVGTVLVFAAASAAAQTPAPAAPPPPPPYGLPITLEQAKKVMVGAEAEAKKNNWNVVIAVLDRSEERRVGKECRYRWSPDHEKKKKR